MKALIRRRDLDFDRAVALSVHDPIGKDRGQWNVFRRMGPEHDLLLRGASHQTGNEDAQAS
jgi:hypothetical protein